VDSGPGPLIANILTNATLLPCITYGMPIWHTTRKNMKVLTHFYLRPIRHALVVPTSTHQLSLFAEFGNLPLEYVQVVNAFSFAVRLLSSSESNPARALF
jgi:hypothetical protein